VHLVKSICAKLLSTVTAPSEQFFSHILQPMQPDEHIFFIAPPLSFDKHGIIVIFFCGISVMIFLGQALMQLLHPTQCVASTLATPVLMLIASNLQALMHEPYPKQP